MKKTRPRAAAALGVSGSGLGASGNGRGDCPAAAPTAAEKRPPSPAIAAAMKFGTVFTMDAADQSHAAPLPSLAHFFSVASPSSLSQMPAALLKLRPISSESVKVNMLAPIAHREQEVKILNHSIRWTASGMEYDADKHHVQVALEQFFPPTYRCGGRGGKTSLRRTEPSRVRVSPNLRTAPKQDEQQNNATCVYIAENTLQHQ